MLPVARTRRTAQNTQHTYPLSCRIHDVKTYPVQSPQGATVLIYGHENGITLVWRGGKRLKAPKPPKEKQNGANSGDAVMIIDSDDEAPAAALPFVDKPEFEDTPTANASALPAIIQTLDLALGTAALSVGVLPMTHCTPEDAGWNGVDVFQNKLVFTVACATSDVYVITLPLTPPSHESKARPELRQNLLAGNVGRGVWGESLAILGGQSRPCGGVAITVFKPKPGSQSSSSEENTTLVGPHAIVAAHSREASGTLRLWSVPLDTKPGTITRHNPFQTEYLPAPLTSISFNPSHITQLLAVSSSHAVRIFDYTLGSVPEDNSDGPFPAEGSWLLSLYPPFARGSVMSTTRKPILAAKWIAYGHAILTLLADGQWGIWDIDGASPSTSTAGAGGSLFSKANAALRGSAITAFNVTGHLEGTSPLRNPATQKSPAAPGSGGEFVPMTPHTRRDALAATIAGGSEKLAAVKGGIDVIQAPPTRGTGLGEESALLWLGGADPIVSVVPVISRFWDSQLRRAGGGGVNLWSGAQPTRMIRLTELGTGLLGERCTGAVGIPRAARPAPATNRDGTPSDNGTSNASEGLPIEVLIQGESRIVIVHESEDSGASLTTRLLGARKKPRADITVAKAILTYPRQQKPNSVAFNLSVSRPSGGLLRPRGAVKGLFDNVDESMEVLPSTEPIEEDQALSSQPRNPGFLFGNDLSYAADVLDDESEAEARDVDQEILDIMEIDRELEQMESERDRGTKRVFFEEG
ncbi:hypothetical protein B0T25DRAFT_457650 [Lasiosphaeria hispida]|uniref:Nucleoporin NUP37 n=1 Tax=Lasiosphaeria hispida TaxID=260671 RepID=A0AAJ0HDI0_9PEZI|nr:hypothetical protein B0T25DRAFT_457650 [Lasiosphaeria hispida]